VVADSERSYSPISIVNSGALSIVGGSINPTFGFYAYSYGERSPINIVSSGPLAVTGAFTTGIYARAYSPMTISNSSDITATGLSFYATGIHAESLRKYGAIGIENSGNFTITGVTNAFGIDALTVQAYSPISIVNIGAFVVTAAGLTWRPPASGPRQRTPTLRSKS
jgi:hypothetical protein